MNPAEVAGASAIVAAAMAFMAAERASRYGLSGVDFPEGGFWDGYFRKTIRAFRRRNPLDRPESAA